MTENTEQRYNALRLRLQASLRQLADTLDEDFGPWPAENTSNEVKEAWDNATDWLELLAKGAAHGPDQGDSAWAHIHLVGMAQHLAADVRRGFR